MLTHCHKCGFHVRSKRLTFDFAAWLKGFYAVAVLSHAKYLWQARGASPARRQPVGPAADSIADFAGGG
jgi:hypothetical protein